MVPEVSDTEFRAERIFAMRREHGLRLETLATGKPTTEKRIPRSANNFLLGTADLDMLHDTAEWRTAAFARNAERRNEEYRDQQKGFKQC